MNSAKRIGRGAFVFIAAWLLAAATSPGQDCNTNGIPDACDLDCGVPAGACDVPGCGQDADCNTNGIPDSCDISSGTSQDCQPDGIPDECQSGNSFHADSGILSPINSSAPASFTIITPPQAQGFVTFSFEASADLMETTEYINVFLNGVLLSAVFVVDAQDCAAPFETAQFSIPANTYNLLIGSSNANINLVPSFAVDQCAGSFVRVLVDYLRAETVDCNANAIPDECEVVANPSIDCNMNEVPDDCDIARSAPGFSDIALFYDTVYVDDLQEALRLRDTLINSGHSVTTFTGTTQIAWSVALASTDVVVIPELDGPDLFAAMAAGARSALQTFVSRGGGFVQTYTRTTTTSDLRLLNEIFFAGLTTRDALGGPLNMDPLAAAGTIFAGGPPVLPASDETNSLRISELPPGAKAIYGNGTQTTLATWRYDSGRITWLGFDYFQNPTPTEWAVVVDRAVRLRGSLDCNTNGVPDECELVSNDCDLDGTPDDCEADCNLNGIPDECDLSGGTSPDCNSTGIPDDCELDGNDCNTNGVPDDCEPDCNGNLIPDSCDIARGISEDCDSNGIPDECELAGDQTETFEGGTLHTTSQVVWTNPVAGPAWTFTNGSPLLPGAIFRSGIIADGQTSAFSATFDYGPTGGSITYTWSVDSESCCDILIFEVDGSIIYSHSGVASGIDHHVMSPGTHVATWYYEKDGSVATLVDAAAIDSVFFNTSGLNNDCNTNGTLDECDISADPALDCDNNGVIDACSANDCNSNGIADECEISSGSSQDCNTNGIPDECDIAKGVPRDARVALYFDTIYVDDAQEALNLRNALTSRGHIVTTFTGTSDAAWTAALSTAEVLVIPELDGPDLFAALPVPARSAIQNFVSAGGSYVQAYVRTSTLVDLRLLNEIFGAGLTTPDPYGGPLGIDPIAAQSTFYSGGPIILPSTSETNSLRVNELPAGARAIYTNSGQTTLATWNYGAGRITWLGYDFAATTTPSEWLEVADRAVSVRQSIDCNTNSIPDACDIATNPTIDCNSNGIIDTCGDQDCDSNGLPDSCDIASNPAVDCDSNGVPDTCDLATGATNDARVALFFDTIYVDDVAEAARLRDSLTSRGHSVVTFTGITTAAWVAALTSADVLVIPELDGADLYAAMEVGARNAVRDFVSQGRRYVQAYCRDTTVSDLRLLNEIFGATLLTRDTFGGPLNLNTTAAAGTRFAGGPASLPNSNETNSLRVAELPPGARAIYSNATQTTLATWTYGAGEIVWLGFDYFLSPTPAEWVEVADRAVRVQRVLDCNTNGILDECETASGTSLDCNSNRIPDECEPDCNANHVADACDLASDFSQDCDINGIPDECDIASGAVPDCNSNGIPDACDPDCNNNNIPDACDIAGGTSLDCQPDAIPDECQIVQVFSATSGSLAPIDSATPKSYAIPSAPAASGTVSLTISASADLSSSNEFISVYLNGTFLADLFTSGATDCANPPNTGLINLSAALFNSIVANGNATVHLLPSAAVTGSTCPNSFANVAIQYQSSAVGDCNANTIPDDCDIAANPGLDCNSNGILDTCIETDCNTNNIPDACDIAQGTSQDCNANTVPDECDLVAGVLAPARVAFFFDPAFVDEIEEAARLQSALTFSGHTVTPFIGVLGTSWTNALMGADVLVVPELDGSDLYAAMEPQARLAAQAFVSNGGTFVQSYVRDTTSIDLRLLNELFGAALLTRDSFGNTLNKNPIAALGTVFEDGPAALPGSSDTNSLRVSELPAGARAIYSNGTQTTLATWNYGSGRIVWLGFDYFQTPTPSEWVQVADLAARQLVSADCNSNGILDECDIAGEASDDCNSDGVPDECQPDCNSNGISDDCDIDSETSSDCNNNSIPDECDIAAGAVDCDSNGIPDECEADCNDNNTVDACDISSGFSLDCQPDGVPDECQLIGAFSASSGSLSPIDASNPQAFTIPFVPFAMGPVTLTFTASADLFDVSEYISVDVNGTALGIVFQSGAVDCANPPNTAQLIVPAATYNAAVSGGVATFHLVATAAVGPGICPSSFIQVAISYASLGLGDCNSNGIPDDCDAASGTSQDCQSDGIPDECQFREPFEFDSGPLGPVHYENTVQFTINNPASTSGNAILMFQASADLASTTEFIDVSVNGDFFESIFVNGASDCPVTPNVAQVTLPAAAYNQAVASGAITVTMKASEEVQDLCASSFIRVVVQHTRADCNTNQIPDECELALHDCNTNGVPDDCDLSGGSVADCNTNGIPDSCELLTSDCNFNNIPDDCDVAAGTSPDVNANGVPDECEFDVELKLLVRQSPTPFDLGDLPDTDSSVTPGSIFYIELWATDSGLLNTGIVGAFADLAFTPGRFDALTIDHRPPFTLLPGGAIDNNAGMITGLGGNDATFGCPGKAPAWVRIAVVECQALTDLCTLGADQIALLASPNEVSACSRGAIPPDFQSLGTAVVAPGLDCVYDRTEDGFINAGDLGVFAGSWLTSPGHPNYNERNDFDCSGFVAAGDLGWFAAGWLQSCGVLSNSNLPPCRRCAESAPISSPQRRFDALSTMLGQDGSPFTQDDAADAQVGDQVKLVWRVVRQPAASDVLTGTVAHSNLSAVNPGESFYLEVWARDDTRASMGLTAVYVDVAYSGSQVALNEINHGGIFAMLASGNVAAGRVDRLGGATLSVGAAAGQWTRVASVKMVALVRLNSGPTLTITPSMDGVSALGRGSVSVQQDNSPPQRPGLRPLSIPQ